MSQGAKEEEREEKKKRKRKRTKTGLFHHTASTIAGSVRRRERWVWAGGCAKHVTPY